MNLDDESTRWSTKAAATNGAEMSSRLEHLGLRSIGMVHDLSNSLQIVISNLELAARAPGNGRSARHLALARIGVDRCLRLARRTLTYGRGTPPGDTLVMHTVLPAIAERLLCAVGVGVTLEIAVTCEDLAIEADEAELESALLNLVLNARDAMDGRGSLSISCELATAPGCRHDDRDWVVVRVEDTGPGMSPEVAQKVTRPFFTTKPNGTGLGLANVKAFVEAAKGRFEIDSRPGRGTAVILSFPAPTSVN